MRCLLIVSLLLPTAHAFAGPFGEQGPQPIEGLRLANGDVAESHPRLSPRAPDGRAGSWSQFKRRNPGPWRAQWNLDTGVPIRVFGGNRPVPGAVREEGTAERAARRALMGRLDLFAPGSRESDFELTSNHLDGDGRYRTIGFFQHHRGLRVLGGQMSVRIKNDRIFMLASTAYPDVQVELPAERLQDGILRARAQSWVAETRGGSPAPRATVEGPFILPIQTPGELRYEVVVRVTVDLDEPFERWDIYLNPEDGRRIAREQTLSYASGDLKIDVPDRWPGNGRASVPASRLQVTVTPVDGGAAENITADTGGILTWTANGAVTVSNAGQSVVNLQGTLFRSGLSSPDIRVVDLRQTAPTTFSELLPPNGMAELSGAESEFSDSNFNVYHSMNVVRDYILDLVPNQPWLSNNIAVAFSNVNGACNAVSDGLNVFLFRSLDFGGGQFCENTGRIFDVVYHEFGHSVHRQSLIPGVGNFTGSHSEGLSDYIAATITDDSGMGRGFFGNSAPLRELDPSNPNTWSRVSGRGTHTEGLSYGGAMWDVREGLIAKLGRSAGIRQADLLWYATTQRAESILTTYLETLAADDDDGTLSNGTPNFCEIQAGFEAHELDGDLGLGFLVGPVEVSGLRITLPVTTLDCGGPVGGQASASLIWSVPGRADVGGTIEMTSSNGDEYVGELPIEALEPGDVVEYRVEYNDGIESVSLPTNPADPRYQLYFGDVQNIFCTDFSDDPFETLGFTSELLAGDAQNPASANDWQWGAPLGSGEDPGLAFLGDNVVGNDLGEGNFNGLYRDGIHNALNIPSIDVAGFESVRLHYRRWLNVEDGRFDQATILANGEEVWANLVPDRFQADRSDHLDSEWRFHTVDLTAQVSAEGAVQLSFQLETDDPFRDTTVFGGWNIDDLCVVGFNPPECGNGEVELKESCDDGNLLDGDGCQADCTPTPEPVCGNGILEGDEVCDDGNLTEGDGCQADCTPTPTAECGNGVLEGTEVCDDGNRIDGDGCQADCTETPEPVCGNGIPEAGEVCDDGNLVDGDGCESDCTLTPDPVDPVDPEDPIGSLQAEDEGCGCTTQSRPDVGGESLALLALLGALFVGRRRRR